MQDRFAIGHYQPPVDPSQDWFLVSGEEENGYTILEFTRNLTSCDVINDLNVEVCTVILYFTLCHFALFFFQARLQSSTLILAACWLLAVPACMFIVPYSQADTARVVWAYHSSDPASENASFLNMKQRAQPVSTSWEVSQWIEWSQILQTSLSLLAM